MAGSMAASAAEATAPLAVEDFSYPGAAKILAERNITLKSGDGHILLADCASGPGLVELFTRAANPSEVCFKITGPTGYLALEIPKVYNIKGDDHTVKATVSTDGNAATFDVAKNVWTPIGEGGAAGSATTLLELNATDGPAGPAPDKEYPAVGTLTVGQPGRAGSRGCTATLVNPQWVLTAIGCFADDPAAVTAGTPAVKSSVTISGQNIGIIELVPRADRGLVMARLGKSVIGVTPAVVTTGAPATTESLQAVGYGRTKGEWVPGKPHTATHTVGAVTATAIDSTPASDSAPLCKGDTGAPFLRTANSGSELAAVAITVGQNGCLDSTDTATGARSSRTDDLAGWIKQISIQPVHGDIPVAGNWDGGPDNVGIYRPSSGEFHLRMDNGSLVTAPWGEVGDVPVSGNWDDAGADNLGVYRPSTGEFHLRMDDGSLVKISWGGAGDIPVVGNWDGGPDNVGVYRPSTGEFHLRMDDGSLVKISWGEAGDIPVAGNWDGGPDNVGVYRPSTGEFHLRMDDGNVMKVAWGENGDIPVSGNWDNAGPANVGVWRPSTGEFHLRMDNGDNVKIGWGEPR
ncbi:trypsin-like serine protease [Kitasatospora sp. NPDC127111]|uniref:trypsin-like serine protease n=1 Tax=Kitasatospora sp. NPDC127111 TaxID=3345363 RepID=UPI003644D5C4